MRMTSEPRVSVALDSDRYVLDLASAQILDPRAGPLQLRVEKACRVSGRVVRPDGAPVPFAHVRLAAPHHVYGHSTRGLDTLADAHGEFAFTGLQAAEVDLILIARGDDVAAMHNDIALSRPGAAVQFEVKTAPAGEVRGIVQDEQGKPVVDATVRLPLVLTTRPRGALPASVPFVESHTDAEGRFRLRGLPAAAYRLCVNPRPDDPPTAMLSLNTSESKDIGIVRVTHPPRAR